ncbi:V-type ATP synthase subunit E [Draconibacterium sp. IB214405]|uniref:V-type ATP synthase subunit E n=1 Tax=Draconibacterium sp. IB214405 TaxID=3097352 RepID=UPI002A1481B1|nr:V-type ATP synthase subunit E [Draconibacterium sp. IB214405]MDX8339104.1 V-type ATP synthase subunit E [Draconibacterium sp. IB214405]
MTDRIEEITQKIYNEGITKAKNDAEQLLAQAKEKADSIIQAAKLKHEEIIHDAQQKAEEEKKRFEAELQLTARQFISQLKQQITTLISTAQVDTAVNDAFNDNEFIKRIILLLVEKWDSTAGENMDLQLLLPSEDRKELTAFLQAKATEAMNKGLEISVDSKLKSGFRIGPKDGSYLISFTAQDFANYFKQYFKDGTKKLLFDAIETE